MFFFRRIRILTVLGILMLASCSKKDADQVILYDVTFGFKSEMPNGDGGRLASNLFPRYIEITVVNSLLEVVDLSDYMTAEVSGDVNRISVNRFGSEYVSHRARLPLGDYSVTYFQVLDENRDVLFAAPVEGSEKAILVDHPLPYDFNLSGNNPVLDREQVTIQVLEVGEEDSPDLFGYVGFSFDLVSDFALDLHVVSDLDSSLVAGSWLLTAFREDSSQLEEVEYFWNPESPSQVVMNGLASFYKIESIDQPEYHQIAHYFEADYLRKVGVMNLSLAPVAINNRVSLSHPDFGLNKVDFYYPKDICSDYFRIDFTGVGSEFYVLNDTYIYADHWALDAEDMNLSIENPLIDYAGLAEGQNFIFRPRSDDFYSPSSFCEEVEDYLSAGTYFQVFSFLSVSFPSENDPLVIFQVDSESQEWIVLDSSATSDDGYSLE